MRACGCGPDCGRKRKLVSTSYKSAIQLCARRVHSCGLCMFILLSQSARGVLREPKSCANLFARNNLPNAYSRARRCLWHINIRAFTDSNVHGLVMLRDRDNCETKLKSTVAYASHRHCVRMFDAGMYLSVNNRSIRTR